MRWVRADAWPEAASHDGMGQLARDAFEGALLRLVEPWLAAGRVTPVIACGMVGSRQGWMEAPYRACRAHRSTPTLWWPCRCATARITVRLVPGLKQMKPADVMRGEETQIAGALALLPGFDGVLCLPGRIQMGPCQRGRGGKLPDLHDGRALRAIVGAVGAAAGLAGEGWDESAFDAALSEVLSRPERIGTWLFGLRAEGLLAGWNRRRRGRGCRGC